MKITGYYKLLPTLYSSTNDVPSKADEFVTINSFQDVLETHVT